MPKFSFPGRIPSFNLVAISYSNKNFPANKNINNNNKNFSNNNKNLKNISQINYPNLKGRVKFKVSVKISISVKFPSIIKFSIKFGNTKFPYYIEIKFNNIINFKFPYYIKFSIKFNTKFPYYIVIIKFPYYIKINNVIGVRQLQEAITV